MIPVFGLNDEEKRKALSIDPLVVRVLREAGVRARPVWREAWSGDDRRIELSTRRRVLLALSPEDLLSFTEFEIVARIRRELSEGSTLDFPSVF